MATAKVKAIDIKSCHLEVRKIGPCDVISYSNQLKQQDNLFYIAKTMANLIRLAIGVGYASVLIF